jgi:hypothetical protein
MFFLSSPQPEQGGAGEIPDNAYRQQINVEHIIGGLFLASFGFFCFVGIFYHPAFEKTA